jgi:hypothetical protein
MSVATYQSSRSHVPEAATPFLEPDISLRLHDKDQEKSWAGRCPASSLTVLLVRFYRGFSLGSSG